MKYEIEIPSKTFLIGEYAVLDGGPAIVVNTAPSFQLKAQPGSGMASGFHPESAAGMFIREHRPLFSKLDIEFQDPHTGRGGFGASGAQYLSVAVLKTVMQNGAFDLQKTYADFKKMLALKGDLSSGADLLSQAVGQAAMIQIQPLKASAHAWPFENLGFAIFRTGVKVNTHEHLSQLEQKPGAELAELAASASRAWSAGDHREWVQNIERYGKALRVAGLVAPTTRTLLSRLETLPNILAAKGSGSLGADTVVVYMTPASGDSVIADMKALGLELVATERDMVPGVNVRQFAFGDLV